MSRPVNFGDRRFTLAELYAMPDQPTYGCDWRAVDDAGRLVVHYGHSGIGENGASLGFYRPIVRVPVRQARS